MKSKKFRDLKKGYRFLIPSCGWEVADDCPCPIDDNKAGLWKVHTNRGRSFYYPDEIVTVED